MDEVLSGLENFDRVWARVAAKPVETFDEAAILRELILKKSESMAFYRLLCRQFSALVPVTREKTQQLRALQGEYFILTGHICNVTKSATNSGNASTMIRALYKSEQWEREYIHSMAPRFISRDTRRVLLDIARQDEAHAVAIKRLIVSIL